MTVIDTSEGAPFFIGKLIVKKALKKMGLTKKAKHGKFGLLKSSYFGEDGQFQSLQH
ncbi:hypothetical protein TcasGA2_TC031329 [Tribolium castaneum]|nr:hypothetical protein TcasGA2_TC031329 [Tribolium castaneum]